MKIACESDQKMLPNIFKPDSLEENMSRLFLDGGEPELNDPIPEDDVMVEEPVVEPESIKPEF